VRGHRFLSPFVRQSRPKPFLAAELRPEGENAGLLLVRIEGTYLQLLAGEEKAATSLTRSAWRLVSVLVKIRPRCVLTVDSAMSRCFAASDTPPSSTTASSTRASACVTWKMLLMMSKAVLMSSEATVTTR